VEFDSVRIGVDDFEAAVRDYETVFGRAALRSGERLARLRLEAGALELEGGMPGLRALYFTATLPEEASTWSQQAAAFNGLDVRVTLAGLVEAPFGAAADGVSGIDHVVIQSPNLDRAVTLWRDQLGIRLALDRTFAARGLRMLFFRSAGVTLEFVSPFPSPSPADGPDSCYGLAYAVRDLHACCHRLRSAGVDLSDIRGGQKRGTIVATVRSHTAGVPTLLVQAIA
jgi:catechol 2,3-dioxygenase-like lactoylglutathione lyase family enzyme